MSYQAKSSFRFLELMLRLLMFLIYLLLMMLFLLSLLLSLKKNSFLLLDWLRFLRASGISLPEKFLSSIKNGSWLKISLGSSRGGYRPPSESFVLDSSIGSLLQNGSVLVEIPLIDKKFYGEEINNYKDELRTIGVKFENAEACEYIGNRLMSLAASSELTRDNVISILKFIKYLGANNISPEEFIKSIKGKRWVKTSRGYMAPDNSVLFSQEWGAVSQISDIPFIDQSYYGNELNSFKKELQLLGVAVKFNQSYQLVVDNVESSKGNLQEISWAGPSSGQQPRPRPKKRRVENDNSITSDSSSY